MSAAKAQRRLQKALDRLEAAARTLKERAGAGEVDTLRADRDRLSAELDKARADYAALAQTAEAASARLDDAVVRLKAAMEG